MVVMNKEEILKKLKELSIDKDKFIVLAGAALVLHGFKDETNDIDIAVSDDTYKVCNGEVCITSSGFEIKEYDCFDIGKDNYDNDNINIIDGYKVASLEALLDFYRKLDRKKDKSVIRMLDLYLGEKDNYRYERELNKKGITLVAGVDEVGRGPLVGNVVAAAVILPVDYHLEGLTDSKKLSEKKREEYYDIIMKDAIAVGIGEISPKVIDEVNIYEASKLAMKEAIVNLSVKPECILIDALNIDVDIEQKAIVKGDIISQSIAAASVIAKVTRDREMMELDKKYPMYEFSKHKGYPTKRHLMLLEKFGVLENYRFTYAPVRDLIEKEDV